MTDLTDTHPNYPLPEEDDPRGDRCVCGGIRHWHAVAPHGCDDCACKCFEAAALNKEEK